ncbi:hypothetical protein niasHT_025951 [Heterodera trifolii]|uniref:B30.2/SPRY domain-containing protein n=1 Tax=Heterodera trifolii TaxID=157864 RepID=A0ABD2KNJ6_9BILA
MRLRTASTQQQKKVPAGVRTAARASSTTPTPISSSSAPSREFSRESSSRPPDGTASPLFGLQHDRQQQQQGPMFSASSVCYCNGERQMGNLEVHCALCKRWFHQNCFQDLKDFGGLPFMVSYVFHCRNCSSDGREKWAIKSATFSHMCVMALANLTLEHRLRTEADGPKSAEDGAANSTKYFSVEDEIIPYMEKHWEYLSTTARRQKKTWHQTIARTLQKDIELFEPDSTNTQSAFVGANQQPQAVGAATVGSETGDEATATAAQQPTQQQHHRCAFALRERDLFRIGPMHEAIMQLSKRHTSTVSAASTPTAVEKELLGLGTSEADVLQSGALSDLAGGPKTRGASKRKAAAALAVSCTSSVSGGPTAGAATNGEANGKSSLGNGSASKKSKLTAASNEFSSMQLLGAASGVFVDVPFNREGYRYYLVEKDPNILNREKFDMEELHNNTRAVQIPSHIYRLAIPPFVTLSPNDRAHQLIVESDNLTVTGFEGHSVVRATHSVSHGSWFYEMLFLAQPSYSHVRVGWAQANAILQASLGYGKFGYSWRSKRGTVFHDAYGKHFHGRDFRQGDVIGCLIVLPSPEEIAAQGFAPSDVMPASRKDCDLIKFKQTYFFEEKDEPQQAQQRLKPLQGSKIEFFLNGESVGVAYEDIFFGHYFPAISLFQSARVRFNFGPKFRHAPPAIRKGTAQPMSARPEQQQVEQALADAVFMTVNVEELVQRNEDYFAALAAKDSQQQQQLTNK